AQRSDSVAGLPEPAGQHPIRVLQQTDDADRRSRVDGLPIGFVVETDVSARNRYVQRTACLADPGDGALELPHDAGALWVAKIEAVGRADWACAGTRDVPRGLGHSEHGAEVRIEIAVAAVAVERHRERAIRSLDAHHARTKPGEVDRVGAHHVIVLTINPPLAGNRR